MSTDARREIVLSDQRSQSKVVFHGHSGRADSHNRPLGQQLCGLRGCIGGGDLTEKAFTLTRASKAHTALAVRIGRPESSPVADEVTIDVGVVAVVDALQYTITFAGVQVATYRASCADGGCGLQIPLARIHAAERLIGENTRRADFDEVAAELAFQHAGLGAPKIHPGAGTERGEILAARIVSVKPHAAITGNAPVHFMVDERSEVLVFERPLVAPVDTRRVPGHDSHILQMTFAAFFADGTVVGMIFHQPLNHGCAEVHGVIGADCDPRAILHRCHAGHGESPPFVVLVGVLHDRALATSADRVHGRVPAEIRQVEAM